MAAQSVIVLGGSGLVGSRLCELWSASADIVAPRHAELDVLDPSALDAFISNAPAGSVVNLAAWADVDGAEAQSGDTSGTVHRLNVDYPAQLAALCRRHAKHLVHVSTDYVFDGINAERPYREDDPTRPLCWYAETKRHGEVAVLAADPGACIARIEMPYTARPHAKRDLARLMVSRLQQGQTLQAVTDQRITPVFLDDAVTALRVLADARYSGVVHVAAADWTTPALFATSIARQLGLPQDLIVPARFDEFAVSRPARRPQHPWLDVTHFTSQFGSGILRSVGDAVEAWTAQWHASVS
jgi:dTDP-4-dehydrorhamnose reductase